MLPGLNQSDKTPCYGQKSQKDRMAIGIARQIILEGVSDQVAFYIMDLKDSKEMWDKLKNICTKIGQKVMYLIL